MTWNEEGYLNSYLYVGEVRNNKIEVIDKGLYIVESPSFYSHSLQCNWLDGCI